jgi:putative membrane protein
MLNLLIDWILSALGLLLVSQIIPGFEVSGFGAALIAALAIGLANATIGLVLKILTFPLTIVSLGVFWFVINALMLELAAAFVPGFRIQGFVPAFLGAIALSIVNLLRRWVTREIRDDGRRAT